MNNYDILCYYYYNYYNYFKDKMYRDKITS